ncbi:hypothetical protein, partial [Escherichia coli]
ASCSWRASTLRATLLRPAGSRTCSALAGSEDLIVHVLVGGCSAFLCVFMLKALLFMERGGAPNHVELHPEEQPQLFAFLYRLADEAGAPRPHRVYLSARV